MAYLAFTKLLSSTTMVFISILVAWLPITILFISNHYAVTRIITRAKWRELNEIQAQIEEIRMGGSLAEKESMEKINRLIEYHDRLMKTRNSTFDLNAGFHFFNSLLIPAVGFILGNLETFQEILGKLIDLR